MSTRTSANRLILIPLSVLACGVMLIAISYAFSVFRAPAATASVTPGQPMPFTPEHPAYNVPHVSSLGGASGPVASITSTVITVGGGDATVSIRISSDTEVYQKGDEKDAAVYEEEFAAFRALVLQAGGTDEIFIAPDRFETVPLTLDDIEVGDIVEIRTDGTTAVAIYRVSNTP